ncbi:thiamine phosphate synthase [Desulfovibrio sp. TomC]|uniref:thiamine phosphate synthase n=1 Tax=Desulfovibrio sp. TomC TaxID=1562888 RepID=UPI000574F2F5|nr:thiamine phosphate synthase [Desulfovibrio sp. TomC]KHK01777.1 Thiamin-phosphate pyrophosphorylase [Desulfovibrio sp. TomC]
MSRVTCDLGLYLVTDRGALLGRDLFDVVARAVAGGARLVQLREKNAATREFVEMARGLAALIRPLGARLIINDRVDVALAAGADGVHVGQDDMHPADVRALVGPDRIVGLSVTGEDETRAARGMPVDYLGAGPVFATATKKDAGAPQGLVGLARMLALAEVPVVAIGAVTPANARMIMATGVAGLAVVSAVCSAADPQAAARELRAIVDAAVG